MLDPVGRTDHFKPHLTRIDCIPAAGLPGELDSVIGQSGMDVLGHGFELVLQELTCSASVSRFNELSDGNLLSGQFRQTNRACPGALHLCDVNVKDAGGCWRGPQQASDPASTGACL